MNGEPALTISVTKLPAANTVEVSNAVRAILPDLEASLDTTNPGATFTVVFDQAPYIQQSIESLATEGLLGLLFAVLVILVFLLSVRATLVTAISIPTSVLITFIGLQAADYTLNILTLGALTIAIGRVVDDSIVVIENIKRHLVAGVDKASTIVHAVREVAGAITASTITTVAVFLPLALVEGVTGELFRPFALTVTIALAASLLVVAHDRAGARVLVPEAREAAQARGRGRDRGGARSSTRRDPQAQAVDELEHPLAPAARLPADHRVDAAARRGHARDRRADPRRHAGADTAHEDELPRLVGPEHVPGVAGAPGRHEPRRTRTRRRSPVEQAIRDDRGRRDGADLDRLGRARPRRGARRRAGVDGHLLGHDR